MKRYFYRGSFGSKCGLLVMAGGFFECEEKPAREALTERFWPQAREAFVRKGQPNPILAGLAGGTCEELPDVPKPARRLAGPEKRWRFDISLVCHDIKFGADARGVLAWPEEPTGTVKDQFIRVLVADTIVRRGDSVEYADYTEVLKCEITRTEEAATHG